MVGARGRRGPARRERRRAALVGAQAPAGRGGVVDRAADERMPEAEAARHVGRAEEIEPQQLVDRLHHLGSRHRGRGRGQLGLERVARHRRSLQREPSGPDRSASSSASAAATIDGTPLAASEVSSRAAPSRGSRSASPRQLLEVEGIAAALLVERVRVDRSPEQLTRLLRGERVQLDPGQQVGAPRPFERARQALGHVARTHGQREEDGRGRRTAQERSQQLDRGRVGPVQVVEHEHERLPRRELLEQRAHGAVAAVALVLERQPASARERRQRGEDVRELAADVVVEVGESARPEPAHVLVERVDEDGEGQVALELGGRAREHEVPGRVGAGRDLGQETRLADARLADEQRRRRAALIEIGQDAVERTELLGAPDEMVGLGGHVSSRRG